MWLHKPATDLGDDPARIADRGGSASGGTVAGGAIPALDRQGAAITPQILIMRMLDACNVTPPPSSRR
ncbi:hypothetical protein [Streptomyces sp. B21-083]|uniref:hypothetical protein n=1 Tax=Streptomyces sp. B21-083 TaxID=3039410 RepID=UPI002FEF600F